jgi:hypothetical protein
VHPYETTGGSVSLSLDTEESVHVADIWPIMPTGNLRYVFPHWPPAGQATEPTWSVAHLTLKSCHSWTWLEWSIGTEPSVRIEGTIGLACLPTHHKARRTYNTPRLSPPALVPLINRAATVCLPCSPARAEDEHLTAVRDGLARGLPLDFIREPLSGVPRLHTSRCRHRTAVR